MGILDDAHRDGVVVGLASECEAPIARQDIDAMLLNQPDTFNLMVIAFLEIMDVKVPWDIDEGYKVTKDDKFSFYQMAGMPSENAKIYVPFTYRSRYSLSPSHTMGQRSR